jgi:hypothetical protein
MILAVGMDHTDLEQRQAEGTERSVIPSRWIYSCKEELSK